MDFRRAKEILKSPKSITVLHNGMSIWIESVDPSTETAVVSTSKGKTKASITELIEIL